MQDIYKAATGKTNDLTPEGMFTVTVKAINPYYRKKNIQGEHQIIHLVLVGLALMQKIQMEELMEFMERTIHIQLVIMYHKAVSV